MIKKSSFILVISILFISCRPNLIKSSDSANQLSVNKNNQNLELCEPLGLDKPKLFEPLDVAISSDGKIAYVVSRTEKFYTRNVIYKISKDKGIEFLKINEKTPLDCFYGDEIELDNDNNLYVNDLHNHRIYKVSLSDGSIDQIVENKEIDEFAEQGYWPGIYGEHEVGYLEGPSNITLYNGDIYFEMTSIFGAGGTIIYKFGKDKSIKTIFTESSASFSNRFFILNNKIYLGIWYETYISNNILKEFSFNKIIYHQNNQLIFSPSYTINSFRANSKNEIFFIGNNNLIYKAVISKTISILAGNLNNGFKDGLGTQAIFNGPKKFSFDSKDNLYLADKFNNAIRKITPEGIVSTFYVENYL